VARIADIILVTLLLPVNSVFRRFARYFLYLTGHQRNLGSRNPYRFCGTPVPVENHW